MKHELPSHFKLLYTRDQIAEANRRMGASMSEWADTVWKRSQTDILTVPVLRGGIFFFADVVREIQFSTELAPTFSQSYEDTENNTQRQEMKVDIDSIPVKGRSVLLIDDICDSGKTLEALCKRVMSNGAQEVRSAVLVRRILDKETFKPDWVGFEYQGPEWLVGYGMDDCNRWRNLTSIHIIRKV